MQEMCICISGVNCDRRRLSGPYYLIKDGLVLKSRISRLELILFISHSILPDFHNVGAIGTVPHDGRSNDGTTLEVFIRLV